MLEIGTTAPDFTLPDQNGALHSLADYRGQKVILYFYPRDNTAGCTKQACGFAELYPQFQEKGEGLDRRLAVKAVRTGYAGWGTMRVDAPARAEDPPPSPVPAAFVHDENEMIELMPIAFTQLRITLFPWTK